MASVEKALTKTLHCQNINQPSTVYLPDTVASFSDKLNSGENKSTITKHDIGIYMKTTHLLAFCITAVGYGQTSR
jgi:hypothetical protein